MKLQASDQLITDDAKTELVKESQVHLLDLNPMETAAQIMVCLLLHFRSAVCLLPVKK